jgi:hypothetical protein
MGVSPIRSRIPLSQRQGVRGLREDPYYEERGNTKPLAKRQEEAFIELMGQLSHAISEGKAVEVLELYDESEEDQVQAWIAEMEGRSAGRPEVSIIQAAHPDGLGPTSNSILDQDEPCEEHSAVALQPEMVEQELEFIHEFLDNLDDRAA